jgi:hypothetical protein
LENPNDKAETTSLVADLPSVFNSDPFVPAVLHEPTEVHDPAPRPSPPPPVVTEGPSGLPPLPLNGGATIKDGFEDDTPAPNAPTGAAQLPKAAPAAPPAPPMALTGIIDGEPRMAVLRVDNLPHVVVVNDHLPNDVTVRSIEPQRVVLTVADKKVTLKLGEQAQ